MARELTGTERENVERAAGYLRANASETLVCETARMAVGKRAWGELRPAAQDEAVGIARCCVGRRVSW